MSKLSSEKRNRLNDSDFGIPEKRMYPLHDKAHIESAVRLFGHAENKYKRSLARKILSRAREYNMDTSGWKQVLSFAQEQVPPMSNGTSMGNSPPRMMAPYYDEQDELLQRANSMDPNSKETMFDKAKRIVTVIHNKTEQDSKPPTGNQNCQLCTWCAEAQFRGINALPRPVYSPRDPALEIKGENIVLRPIRRSFTSQRDVVETVRGAVDSRWYVHVNWAESTGGHEFLVVNLNDYAYIMDAQAGLLKEIDESDSSHNYFRDINFRNSYMVRLDDREFNTKLFNEMNDPSKVMPWKNSLDIPYMRDNGMLAPGADDDPRFRRVPVPSEEGTKYMKQDPELSQYWEELNKATTGEFLVDRETGEQIGHVFVHTNKNDKGFIFNLEVNPKYRRQGYGWILTDDAVRRLGGEDLTVDADNTPAVNLYLQYGFTIYKKGQWHYDPPKDELWMKYDRSKLMKQESFMDNLKTIGSVVKNGVNDFIFPDESDKELKLEPYTGDVPYQLYAVTKDGTVTEATPLFKTKRDALIDYARKKVESEVMRDTGLKRADLRFEKGSDFYIPSTINCITYVDYDKQSDLIADDDSVDIDGYCTTINTVNIPKENIKTDGRLHITNLDSSDIFDNERFKCRFNVELRDYGKDYDNNYAYESFMNEYAKRVNDKGDPVPEKCKCGGKVSITLKGEPIYSCEACGKYYGTLPCNIQEGVVRNIRDMTLIPVKDFKYNKVYYGDPTDGGSVRKLDDKPLFVTPHMGLASIFVGRRHIFHKLSEMGYHEVNLGYDEWASTPDQPLTDVHVYVRNAPNLKPFTVEFDGYLHTIDCSQLKDNIYRYPWMSDTEHEILIAKVPEVKIDNVQKLHIRYHVRGIEEREPSSHVQEGAFQDLKNGVNPYSDNMVFHVTPDKHVDGQIWKPRVPDYLDPYNPEDTGFEDNTTPRICFSTSIEGALNGITVNLQRQSPDTFDKMYVYVPEKPWKEYKHKTNKQLVKDKLVYDANVTREVWIMEPVRMKLYGVIRVDQIADAKRKSVVPTSKGQKDTRNYFTYKWHWVVKPKVLEKATKFDYSPERVIDDLCIDVKKFKYGLIKDGKLQTGNVSDADYDKYWVFHSGETVDQAGGGNCYDMVEYEAGYLEAFGVPYKKYYMNFTDTKNKETISTHTICVVPHNGKFIYIEQAFKRVVDEWGYERKKVFDKLNDIFEYVAEVTAEYENQDLNYGVWDYTNAEIDYGTPIKNFMEWIMTKCKMIYDGEATKSKSTVKKEGYKLNRFNSRFFQEEEEALSDTEDMEDITIGDLNLDDDDGDNEENEEEEEKISISDEELEDGENTSSEEEGEDDFSADMEVPGYLKERMSEDDVESFEQPDENLNADNVDLGQFGKDQSDVQNDYDQKEIDILMKLMASEADAMNEYMDGAKETNVDVLRRLYADIANEERFHMEQLLFAKSELTGEKYQPRDPEVKSEYEELLKMGMDEETAMQTAVDKCHIRGSITEDDGEKMVEIQQDVETMEMAISMFNAQFDNVLMMMESKSFKKEDVEHAVDVFVEACCVQEEVYNVNTDKNKGGYLNQGKASANPIDLLRKGLGFIIRVLRTLITKFVEFLKRVRNHSRAIRTYVKRYGIEGIFASSKETTKMYFIDLDAPACINDSAETLLALTVDTYNACARSAGFQQQLPIGNLKRDSRFNIGGNIDKGIQILNGVQLIKTKMVIPKDKQKQEEIAACLFGYNEQRVVVDSGESYNTLNRLKVMSDTWSAVLNGVNKQLEQMNTLRTQQGSIYYNNRKKYDLVIKGFETIIKTGKGVVTALQNDMNAIMKLNNEVMDISIQKTQQQDQDRMDRDPQLKQWNQNYKQNVDKGLK